MALSSLEDLFYQQLRDLYDAEQRFSEALPKMEQAANSSDLKSAFRQHIQETQEQVSRLEQVGTMLNIDLTGERCAAAQGIVKEGEEMMQEAQGAVLDAGLIASAQRIEHYEIAGYGTVCAYADQLGQNDAGKLLKQTLQEEEQTDQKLNRLAVNTVNPQAASA